MEYTFGILSFNQELYILELLESIKYQIKKYGRGIKFYLYLSDDASKDKTVEVASIWLEENSNLFQRYEILTSSINEGTAKSYAKLLDKIETEFFKVIAGDDLFAKNDIFENLKNNNVGTASAHVPLLLKDGVLLIEKNIVYNNLINKNRQWNIKKEIERFMYGGYISTPAFFPTRSLINEKCIDFMKQFDVFEDDPTWYMLLKSNKGIEIRFDINVEVLYRIHSNSVSNSGSISERWYNDVVKLRRQYLCDTRSLLQKIYSVIYIRDIKNRFIHKKNNKISIYNIVMKFRRIITETRGKKYLSEEMNKYLITELKENKLYYEEINKIAKIKWEEIEGKHK